MFYCDGCREERNWPESPAMSIGRCEICGNMRSCWDVKSSNLPLPADDRYGKDVKPDKVKPLARCACIEFNCKDCRHRSYHLQKDWCNRENMSCNDARNIKPLAQYLDEYIEHESEINNIGMLASDLYAWDSWRKLFEQALDAYQSSEGVRIKIEKI